MNQLPAFKSSLEKTCKIISWMPTNAQLIKIAAILSKSDANTAADISSIISEECPSSIFQLNEGLDNSDLRTLLALAIQVSKPQ